MGFEEKGRDNGIKLARRNKKDIYLTLRSSDKRGKNYLPLKKATGKRYSQGTANLRERR